MPRRQIPAIASTLAMTLLVASCSHVGDKTRIVGCLSSGTPSDGFGKAYPMLLEYGAEPCGETSPLADYYGFWERTLSKAPATPKDILAARARLYACICAKTLSARERQEADEASVQLEHSDCMLKAQLAFQKAMASQGSEDFQAFLDAAFALSAFRAANPGIVADALKAYEQRHADILGLDFAGLFKDARQFRPIDFAWTCEISEDGGEFRAADLSHPVKAGSLMRLRSTLVLPRFRHQTYLNFHALPANAEILLDGVSRGRAPQSQPYSSMRIPLPDFDSAGGSVEVSIQLPAKIPPSIRQPWLSERE